MEHGVDLSTFNKDVDYNELKNNIEFAILRVGYGVQYMPDSQKDELFEEHYRNLKGKTKLGAYYYQYANKVGEGKKEAENCIKYLDGKELELPIFYDVEDTSLNNLNSTDLTSIIIEFCETIESAGYKAGVYANKYFLENKLETDRIENYVIWCAAYGINDGEEHENAKYNGKHEIWQYTSKGNIAGVNGDVDLNLMYKDISEILETPTENEETVFSGDENIKEAQIWLQNQYGYNLKADGYYGPETKKYLVMALQHELNTQFNLGLVEDGIFGNLTYNASINVRQGATGNITHIIQAVLYCKGYNTNGIEGIYGEGTTSAIRKFQKDKGLSVDGICGKNTFRKLFE